MRTEQNTRRAARLVMSLAALIAALWVADSAVAMRGEARLSARVEEHSGLAASPDAYLGGFPFVQVFFTHELPSASVDMVDVHVEGLGMVNARTDMTSLEIPATQALAGDVVGAPAAAIRRSVSLDPVTLGALLDMTDLDIKNPYDISPSGGTAAEVELTGTPSGAEEPVTVLATLRLRDTMFAMEVIEGPAEWAEAFELELDTRQLPLGGRATAVHVQGGSIRFESTRYHTHVQDNDLTPLPST